MLNKFRYRFNLTLLRLLTPFMPGSTHVAFVGAGSSQQLCHHMATLAPRRVLVVTDKPLRDLWPSIPQKVEKPRYRVAFFAGCLNDFVYPELGGNLVRVLNRLGVEVSLPLEQNCCGVPGHHAVA